MTHRSPVMVPAGYMSKRVVAPPEWLSAAAPDVAIDDVYSVSTHVSDNFADYIKYWRHNGYWLFNSASDIEALCQHEGIDISQNTMFFYEVFELESDRELRQWVRFGPDLSFETDVQPPLRAKLAGYDVVTFSVHTSPECSPLSCNMLAGEIPVNRHCLLGRLEDAFDALDAGKFDNSEPGPFRIFAVYVVGQ